MLRFPTHAGTPGVMAVTLALLAAATPSICAGNPPAAAAWSAGLERLKHEPHLARLYPFTEGTGLSTRNVLDDAPFSEMVIAGRGVFAGGDNDCPRWVSGRWPGKPALSIGTMRGSIGRTHFYGVDGKDFTVALWVRTLPDTGRVVFASVGDGFSNGWRLNTVARGIEFVLGRTPGTKPGEGLVVVHAGDCLRPHVWQQVVAVLDGPRLRLAVDGKVVAEKEFDGIYTHPATPAVKLRAPEIDFGGLQLGTTDSQKSASRFDIDELAIFARALDAGRIAELYAAGKAETPADEQRRKHEADLVRQRQLDGITLAVPTDTFGYFPHDQAIPVIVSAAAAAAPLFEKAGTVDFAVSRIGGEPLANAGLPLPLRDDGQARVEYAVAPDLCGLYVLTATVRDHAGHTLKTFRIDFARRLPLPPRERIPPTTMLESYVGLKAELPTFGTTIERVIQPIYGRAPDGGANFAASDAFVDRCSSMGLDALYCIDLGFWENGRYKQIADWKADPRVHTDHVRTLANRYKGRVKYWEIFNEPNAHGTSAEDYVALLAQAHDIIKEVDPAAKIVGPCGTSNYHDWTEAVLAAGGGRFLDILSFHNYLGSSPIRNRGLGRVEAVRGSMRRHLGRDLPMWNSECGIHQPARIAGRPATDEDILRMYGGRAVGTDGIVIAGVDAISMVNEHLGACWQAQSLLVERAQGVLTYFLLMRPSQPYPRFSPGDECVTEKGVALAAVQSLLIDAVAARFIATNVGGTAGVAVADRDGKTHVALFADKKTRLVFSTGLKAGARIKALDFLGNPLSFQADADGLVSLELWHEPIYLLDVPASFTVNTAGLKLACGTRHLEPMSQVKVVADVCNPFDREVTASLVPEVSAGTAAAEATELTLAPGETRQVPIAWRTGGMAKGPQWIRAQLHLDGRFFSVAEAGDFSSAGAMTRIPRFPGTFTMDGDVAKWADIPAEIAATREQVVIGRPVAGAPNPAFWDGADDLSYSFKSTWSGAGIHFLLEVTDNILRPPATALEDEDPGRFDGVELFLDARPQDEGRAAPGDGVVRAAVALRAGESIAECPVRCAGKEPAPVTIRCVSRTTATGYLVEGTVAPATGGTLPLADGARLDLDIAVNDNDDRPGEATALGRRVQMALHGTAANRENTSHYGRYVVSAEPPRPNLVPDGALSRASLLAADARGHEAVPGWLISHPATMPSPADESLSWGAKRVDGRNALWIGTRAEAHLETSWDLSPRIPIKGGTGYSASCHLRGQVAGEALWSHCSALVIFFDDKGNWLGHQSLGGVDVQRTPGQWQRRQSRFITPAGATSIGLRATILSKNVQGFADYYWTDFELREMPERQLGAGASEPD